MNTQIQTVVEAAEQYPYGGREGSQRKSFIAGAKWMKERMYSEEDMIEFYLFCIKELLSTKLSAKSPNEYLEQFKKK